MARHGLFSSNGVVLPLSFLEVVLLGFVEGITEFLPVSSTAHLILTNNLLHIARRTSLKASTSRYSSAQSFPSSISIGESYSSTARSQSDRRGVYPTAVLGLLLYKIIKGFLFESNVIIIGALIVAASG